MRALTDADLTARYWGHSNVSDWQPGSSWEHRRTDGSGITDVIGTVLESVPPRRLTMTFDAPGAEPPGGPSKVTFDIEPYHEIVRLTVTHENLADGDALEAISGGWPAVCAGFWSQALSLVPSTADPGDDFRVLRGQHVNLSLQRAQTAVTARPDAP